MDVPRYGEKAQARPCPLRIKGPIKSLLGLYSSAVTKNGHHRKDEGWFGVGSRLSSKPETRKGDSMKGELAIGPSARVGADPCRKW